MESKAIEVTSQSEAMDLFAEKGWTDGLPIIPPTEKLVDAFLQAASLASSEVLGVEPTKGAVVTAEKAAINAVMAGCLPEYMPVVAAAIRAMTKPEFGLHGPTVSTMGASPLTIVTGPIAEEIGINSGVSLFGPGSRASATIGRAIRLVIQNVLGTSARELDKATLGHAGKYTWCIAEDEATSPWEPLHVTRGAPADASAVTVLAGLGPIQVSQGTSSDPESILDAFKDTLFACAPLMREVVLILGPEHIEHFRKAGWRKEQVGEYLHETVQRPASAWAASYRPASGFAPDDDTRVSALFSPESAITMVAGGAGGAFSQIIPTWSHGHSCKAVTSII